MIDPSRSSRLTRRRVLRLVAGLGATVVLAACGGDDDDAPVTTAAAPSPTAAPPQTPTSAASSATPIPAGTPAAASPSPTEPTTTPSVGIPSSSPAAPPETADAEVLVGDVVDFTLEPAGRWDGPFGSVTLKLHNGHFDGEDVYFIRTDASDEAFAAEHGLVYVPLMQNALKAPSSIAKLYLFADNMDDQGAVVTTIPGQDNYTSAFRIQRVTFTSSPELLTSEAEILDAEQDGRIEVEETDIIVNYPLVVWPNGGLPVDPDLLEPLGKGPLVEEPDVDGGTVTFKLHQCFPGSRYIVTDTSAVPMAPMMGVVGSGPTQQLKDISAVAPITIFVNGLTGPGVMGFQPAIFNTTAGDPAWSPFWDHFAAEWADPSKAVVVRSQSELDKLVASGDLKLYNGLPDTHPNGFVVNCPAPILAPNTYTGQ